MKSKTFSDSYKTFIESIPGPFGQNKLQSNLSRYVNPSDVSLVKKQKTVYSVVLIRKHCQQSPPTQTVNLLDTLVQLSSCHQSSNPNLLKNLHFRPCSFEVKTSRDTQPTNVGFSLPTNMSVKKPSVWVYSHPLPCTSAHLCS